MTNPTRVMGPCVDLQLLTILAGVNGEMSRGEISKLAPLVSSSAIYKALMRLGTEGIVHIRKSSGSINFYSFNRDHVAADAVVAATGLRQKLFERIKSEATSWAIQPISLAIFGSAARGDGTPESDIDVLVIRPNKIQEDSTVWEAQIYELTQLIYKWSGNHTNLIQADEKEIAQMKKNENKKPIVKSLERDALYLVGSDLIAQKS